MDNISIHGSHNRGVKTKLIKDYYVQK